MSHDDFDLPNKHEKKEFRHLPLTDSMDQRGYGRQEYEMRPKYKKSKATSIALAIMSSLLVLGVGYELVKHNIVLHIGTGVPQEKTPPAKKKSVLLSTPKEATNRGFSNGIEEEEDYQLNFLKEQNKQQVAKIKNLRQELLDKMHNVQEIKAHLFKYNRTHDDKIVIGDLQRNLLEKMQQNDQLKLNISSIEQEALELDKKIAQLEVTRDTLMGMLEKQQLTHLQEVATLKNEVNELNNSSKNFDPEKRVEMLEIAQKHLTDSLLKKNGELEKYQNELIAHQQLLYSKTAELESLLQKHNQSKMEIRHNAIDLVANIEFEVVAKEIANRNFLKALDEKANSIGQLKQQVAWQEKSNAISQSMMTEQEKEFNHRNRNLIWALETEALRNEHHWHEHDKTLKQQTDKFHASKQDMAKLQKNLEQQSMKAVVANEQIAGLSDLHSYHQQRADSHLQNIAFSHELESTKASLLTDQLQDALLKLREVKNEKEDIQKATHENLLHVDWLSGKLIEKEQQQRDHELQWYALTASQQNGQKQAGEQARKLADIIETERLQNQSLSEELAQNQKKIALGTEQTSLLEAQLREIILEVNQLEAAIQTSSEHLEKKDNELHRMKAELSLNISERDKQLEEHQISLNKLKIAYQNVHKESGEQAQNLADIIDTERLQNQCLSDELSQKQKEIIFQEEKTNLLKAQLEEIIWEVAQLEATLQISNEHLKAKDNELHRTKAELTLDLDEKNNEIEEHQLRLQALKAAYQNVQKQAGEQAQNLADIIETERFQNRHQKAEFENVIENIHFQKEHLADELTKAEQKFASQEELTNLVSKHLEEIVLESNALEEALNLSQGQLDSKHHELKITKTNFDRQLDENERYLIKLEENTKLLEDQLYATKQQLEEREDALSLSQSQHHFNNEQLAINERHLKQLENNTKLLEDQLFAAKQQLEERDDALAHAKRENQETYHQLLEQQKLYSTERDRVDYLESDLVDYLQQITRLETNIELITDRFEKEAELRSHLESELSHERQKTELVMTEFTDKKDHFENPQKDLKENVEKNSSLGLYGRFMRFFE